MKLEEAVGILSELHKSNLDTMSMIKRTNTSIIVEYELENEAIETVILELEHLQKENEEYSKQLDLDYVDENFVSKDKIRKKIKQMNTEGKIKIKKLGGTDRCLTKLEYMHKENVLQELLNED